MTQYKAVVEYELINEAGRIVGTFADEFFSLAKGPQYVKEQYHRYTHENYIDVNRKLEDMHMHPLGNGEVQHTLVEVQEVDYINGLTPISQV